MRWRRIRTGSTGGIRSTCGHDFGSRELASRFLGFPSEKYDDQVDSTTIFLEYVQERIAYEPVICPCIVGYYRPAWLVGL